MHLSNKSQNRTTIIIPNTIVPNRRQRQSGHCQLVGFAADVNVLLRESLHVRTDHNQRAVRVNCCGNATLRLTRKRRPITEIQRIERNARESDSECCASVIAAFGMIVRTITIGSATRRSQTSSPPAIASPGQTTPSLRRAGFIPQRLPMLIGRYSPLD